MISAICTTHRHIELRDVPKPEPGPGETIVKVRSCGICGSDLHFYAGGFPPPPVCPGHEISGEVAEVGAGVSDVKPGDRVAVEPLLVCRECSFCRTGDYQLCRQFGFLGNGRDGGFAEYVRVASHGLFKLPSAVDFEVGALTEPLAVAVHGLRLANVRLGDRVVVQGAGTIGLMAAAAARAAGAADVWITARHAHQAQAALRIGATRAFTGPNGDSELHEARHASPVDVVVETVGGTADTLGDAVHIARKGGTVVVLGLFTNQPAINALLLVARETRIIGSNTYGRTGARADFDVALQILAAQPERYRELITHRFPLAQIHEGFETASDKKTGAIKVAVQNG